MKIRYTCPKCRTVTGLSDSLSNCTKCASALTDTKLTDGKLAACICCGGSELYRRKDFPQWLGMLLLGVACLLFFIFAIRYEYAIAWTILLGSAAFDGIIYLIVGDVVICYRCGAEYRGLDSRAYDPFELSIAEKYRQERLRLEQSANDSASMPR